MGIYYIVFLFVLCNLGQNVIIDSRSILININDFYLLCNIGKTQWPQEILPYKSFYK